jgi:hypothetical protein
MPVRKVMGGYRWGNSGKVYPTRPQAQRQGRAIYASGYANGGIASLIPLNARTFFRNLMRDKGDTSSLLTPEQFSPEQIELIYKQIDEQERRNAKDEAKLASKIARLEKGIADPSSSEAETLKGLEGIGWNRLRESISQADWDASGESFPDFAPSGRKIMSFSWVLGDEGGSSRPHSYAVRDEFSDQEYSANVQRELDEAQKKLASYETTRDRISVSSYGDKLEAITSPTVSGMPTFLNTVKASFTSPAYNIGTTLGRYTAYKNEDGSVTIKDKYNWNWQFDGPEGEGVDIPLPEFIRMIPTMIEVPEALGNVLMRTLFKGKQSPVEFTLPPRQKNTTTDEMPEDFREGGRVRLI